MILEIVVFTVFIVFFFAIALVGVRLKLTNLKLEKDVKQGLLDYFIMAEQLEKALQNTDAKKIEETEGFLKFVSDSRDWAFQYIERVQIGIKNFQDVFHPIAIKYYENKEEPINQEEFGKLFEAYKKLVEELPDEGKNN